MTAEPSPIAANVEQLTNALRRCGVLGDGHIASVTVESSRATVLSRIVRLASDCALPRHWAAGVAGLEYLVRRELSGGRAPRRADHQPERERSEQRAFGAARWQLDADACRMLDHPRADLDEALAIVANSAVASGLVAGIAARTPCISQNAAVCRTSRTWLAVALGSSCGRTPAAPCAA